MSDVEVGLLDIVPWTHGYAHSWALRWMLEYDAAARNALLNVFFRDHDGAWCDARVDLEHRVGRHRADLRIVAMDAAGDTATVLVETKVNDELSEAQLRAYCATGATVVVYAPGLTGLLLGGNARSGGREWSWLTGRQVSDALRDVDLPHLLRTYLDEVVAQADRMDAARAAARGEPVDEQPQTMACDVSQRDVDAVAWVVEVAARMRASGALNVWTRSTPRDYGVYWPGSRRRFPNFDDAGLYVDVVVSRGGGKRAVTVKAGGGQTNDRVALRNAIRDQLPGRGWREGQTAQGNTFRVWTRDARTMTPARAADVAAQARDHILKVTAA